MVKKENLIMTICAIVIVLGTILKISHYRYSDEIIVLGFMLTSFYQSYLIKKLKNIISELENKKI